jgi:hypothetical protein
MRLLPRALAGALSSRLSSRFAAGFVAASCGFAFSSPIFAPSARAQTPVELQIEVGATERQAYQGLGASFRRYHLIPEAKRLELSDLVVRDLGMRYNRIWISDLDTRTVDQAVSSFVSVYINSGQISEFAKRGVTHTIVTPAMGPRPPADIPAYMQKIADILFRLRRDHNVNIYATTFTNEPENWPVNDIFNAMKILRDRLDARPETASILLLGAEMPNSDQRTRNVLNLLRDDPVWQRIHGVSSHSYSNGGNDWTTPVLDDKPWWQTESSELGNEQLGDDVRGVKNASRFLNDMNHLITHWFYFIGFMDSPNSDTDRGAKLIAWNPDTNQNLIFLKYHYLKRLTETFEPGAVFRRTTNPNRVRNQPASMQWKDPEKPATNAAVARNQDGSWAIGITNNTGLPAYANDTFRATQHYNTRINIPELASAGNITFNVWRTSAANVKESLGTVTMVNGVINLGGTRVLNPRDLITLRSGPVGSKSHAKDPIGDATVRGGIHKAVKHNSAEPADLKVKGTTNADFVRHAFLKFDVGGLQSIAGAGLNLVVSHVETGVSSGNPVTVTAHICNNDGWTEAQLDFETPRPLGSLIGSFQVTHVGQSITLPLTNAVKAEAAKDGRLTILLRDTVNKNLLVAFHSKETANQNARPILAVTRP